MSQTANVRSIDALKDLKIALITFTEDARNALSSTDMDVRRTRDWLQRDQLTHWQAQVKRREQDVATAKSELFRRKVTAMNSDAVSDTDQKEALRLANRRLEQAHDMVAKIKRTIPYLEHAIAEYQATSQPLGDMLTGSFVNSINLVERMVISLEKYLALNAPSAPKLAPDGAASVGGSPSARAKPATASSGDSPASETTEADSNAKAAEETSEPVETQEGVVS